MYMQLRFLHRQWLLPHQPVICLDLLEILLLHHTITLAPLVLHRDLPLYIITSMSPNTLLRLPGWWVSLIHLLHCHLPIQALETCTSLSIMDHRAVSPLPCLLPLVPSTDLELHTVLSIIHTQHQASTRKDQHPPRLLRQMQLELQLCAVATTRHVLLFR